LSVGYRISERRAYWVTRLNRGTYRYRGHKDPRTALRMRIREIAQARVRYGYRKVRVLLNREGWGVGKSLMQRLYREKGLGLKTNIKTPTTGCRTPPGADSGDRSESGLECGFCAGPTDRWAAIPGAVHHGCIHRRMLGDRSGARSEANGRGVLNRIRFARSAPKTLFCDNGPSSAA
jgi:putative transposase